MSEPISPFVRIFYDQSARIWRSYEVTEDGIGELLYSDPNLAWVRANVAGYAETYGVTVRDESVAGIECGEDW